MIIQAKYHGDLGAAWLLADLFVAATGSAIELPECVVPIPMPWPRQLHRGYNHAAVIATHVATRLAVPVRTDLLVRAPWRRPQQGLNAELRRANARGSVRPKAVFAGLRHVALVDDVVTTGATLSAAAAALRQAGVSRVDAWVLARD